MTPTNDNTPQPESVILTFERYARDDEYYPRYDKRGLDVAKHAWEARQPEIDALRAENRLLLMEVNKLRPATNLHLLEELDKRTEELAKATAVNGDIYKVNRGFEAELRTVKEERERMREALEKLNGFSRRDLGETDLHAYVNETCQEALTATPAKEEGEGV